MNGNSKKTILLVEDEAVIAMSGTMALRKLGYDVVVAHTGEAAVELFQRDPSIDLILMDIELGPGIDGTDAARIILQETDIPVVFMSSHTEPEIVAKTEKITSYGYVVKGSCTTVIDASIKMAFRLFHAKRDLAGSEERYHQLFEHNMDAFALHEMIYDEKGEPIDYRFLAVNPAFERITGLQAAEVLNRSVLEVLPNTEQYWIDTYGKVARTGIPVVFENYTGELDKHVEVTAFQPAENQFACVFTDITEHKRAETALLESTSRFDELAAKIPVGVYVLWMRAEGRMEFEYVSDRWCAIHKLRREDVMADVALANNLVHPDERELFLQRNRQATCDRKPFLWEGRFRVGQGELRWLRIESTPVELGNGDLRWFGFTQDITETRQMEEALRAKEEQFRALLETTADGFWVVGSDGTISLVNESYCRMSGYTRDELIGMQINMIDAIEHPHKTSDRMQRILRNGSETFETRHRRKDGTIFDAEVSASRLDHADQVSLVCFCRDITDRKQTEENLKRIEWMLGKNSKRESFRQVEHDQGYGDLTELNRDGLILKSIGKELLGGFVNDYLDLLETSSAIYEVNGDYAFGIFSSGWCRLMDSASRKLCNTRDNTRALDSGQWLCHESCWNDCAKEAIARRRPVDIGCNGGIRLYAEPIMARGHVIGTINFGYGDPPKDQETLQHLAEVYNTEYDVLLRESRAYRTRPQYIIELAKSRLRTTARLIGSMIETKQSEDEARKRSEENIVLLGEAHHRIKNSIASIEGFLSMQADSTSSAEAAAALRQAVARVHSVRALYETLLISKDRKEISIKSYVDDIVDLLVAVNAQGKSITIARRIEDFTLSAKTALPLGIIINELLTNVFKYAFGGRTGGRLAIEIGRTNDHVTLVIQDDGIGLDDRTATNKSPGFGLVLVGMLAEQLNGTYSVEASNGTRSVVAFEV
jgi:PAS domain S-box-containing protein